LSEEKHITAQLWIFEQREDGVYLIGEDDRSVVLKLCRPDHGSDLLIAGYIAGLQVQKLHREKTP
jgi:Ser/Thr protein kinase RdoA (MazF antagonist)